jgi:flagellum-specific peptidoglycan hydrolase FlgJ
MEESYPLNTSLLELSGANSGVEKAEKRSASNMRKDDNLANDFSNLTFQSRAFATHEDSAERAEKKRKQLRYVERFADVAREEMKKYGIPASIKLAQGLLESNAGESRLAVRNKNHFGIKCFSRSCKKGHCSNFTDDHHKDFFRIYPNSWESYRAHSLLMKAERYRSLYQLDSDDFVGWAYGLKKAGYATDDNYAEKLIELILDLELHHYDR